MHSFGSIYTALIKTSSVSRIVYSKPLENILLEVSFFAISISLFKFSSFYLPESKPFRRTFDQITLAHSSLFLLNFIAEGHL